MPSRFSRLRLWFAMGAIAVSAMVAGAYLYAKWRVENALKQVPGKIGIEVQQSAEGFTISKSESGRTLYKIQASKAVQYKEGGRAELHDVSITVYGRDSSRFDQIYGSDFEYDPQSGNVMAKGEVQIDMEANPAGLTSPDQAPPKELKNPVHLKASGLVFNQKTGNAHTAQKVEFSIPQASGSALGVSYSAKDNRLTLQSQVNIAFSGAEEAKVRASRATITKSPSLVVLENVRVETRSQTAHADRATLFLRKDNTVERVLTEGNLSIESGAKKTARMQAAQMELFMAGTNSAVRIAVFSGDVRLESIGPGAMQASAGKVTLNFSGKNVLTTARAEDNVRLLQRQKPTAHSTTAQDMELTAPSLDFRVKDGRQLESAWTAGPPQISLQPAAGNSGQRTVITAGVFKARFDDLGQLASVHGSPEARIVSTNPGQPDRVSTSDTLDATFRPGTGIETVVQQGNFAYADGDRKAFGGQARYTPADQVLVLTGAPRVVEGGMTTTARGMRLNRTTGDAFADGDVKTTYSDLKAQPGGALLASSSPIHVTARAMTAHRTPAVALYTGEVRLWQDANVVEAPSIEFDREHRTIVAHGTASHPISTVLVQANSRGGAIPVTVTSSQLTYADSERRAHYNGNIVARGADATVTAGQMDVYLQARDTQTVADATSTSRIERIVAKDRVVVAEPERRATGGHLEYTVADDKYVMTGDSPSIFDAEHGKITGVSLTFFRRDDRVLVEGNESSPTVTRTRVAR